MTVTKPMPEFDNPPVSEVALSVEFSPLERWSTNLAFSYGKLLQEDYPKMEVHPALPSQIEKFGDDNWQPLQVKFEVVSPDSNRFWFLAEPAVWIIQIQKDRFILNWRKVRGDEKYPRYLAELRPRFAQEWERFQKFIEQQGAGNINVRQCEVTYVNDILRGEGWQTMSDGLELIAPLAGDKVSQFLPPPESLSFTAAYLFPEEQGRLHVSVNHALRQLDSKEVLQMRLLARGRPQSSTSESILNLIDTGREWVVRGFADMTTKKAHAIWGRKQ